MDSLSVIRKVLVRSLVNPKLREVLSAEIRGNLGNLEQEFSKLQQHREGYLKQCREQDAKPDYEIMKRMAMEEEKYKSSKVQLEARLKDVTNLSDGDEYVHGTVDSSVEVEIGHNWHSVMTGMEVVLEDGIVKEIRKRDIQV
jgi:hypothetical protein